MATHRDLFVGTDGAGKLSATWRRRAFAVLVLWFAALLVLILPWNLLGASVLGAGVLTEYAVVVKATAWWTLIAVTAGLLAVVVWRIGKSAVATYQHQMEVRHRHERLHRLSYDEKRVRRHFIQSQTGRFSHDGAVALGLSAKRILYVPQDVCCIGFLWTYRMQPWAREYLQAHPALLDESRD